jgi:hypothetical protein
MTDTSGPILRTPLAHYDPDLSCWKTSQGTFLWDSGTFSETWPQWGTTRSGELFVLPTPELHTTAPVSSSLLPTPRTSDTNGAGSHGDGGLDLRTTVKLLPTPAVNDMGAGKTVEQWDEWTARMQQRHSNGNGHGPSLAIEAMRLGASTLRPSKGGSESSDGQPQNQLSLDVMDPD